MSHIIPQSFAHPERGATLLVAMVVLLALSLAGIAAMYMARSDTEIAGNLRFRDQAMSGAEIGRQGVVQFLKGATLPPELGVAQPSWFYTTANTPVNLQGVDWDGVCNAIPCKQTLSDGNIAQNIVEALGPISASSANGQSLSGGRNYQLVTGADYYYRVTTRTSGPRGTTSLVQVIYRIHY